MINRTDWFFLYEVARFILHITLYSVSAVELGPSLSIELDPDSSSSMDKVGILFNVISS